MRECLKLFLSSPGDVPEERALAERVLRRLARQYRDHFDLSVLLWEHEPLSAHAGFQTQIEPPSHCDLVVSILWSRLGTRLPLEFVLVPGELAPTGTEFEIREALAARRQSGHPDVWLYRRTTPPRIDVSRSDARDHLAQYEALEAFLKRQMRNDQGDALAHHRYDEPRDFERAFTSHLRKWLERRLGETQESARWLEGSPYRGLQVFEAEHRDVYFGRTQAVSEVLRRIRAVEVDTSSARLLLVQGMSGIGKSSLLRAGVLPLLEGRAVEGVDGWEPILFKPSETLAELPSLGSFAVLAKRLQGALPDLQRALTKQSLAEQLISDPATAVAHLHGYISQSAARQGSDLSKVRLVVCVDQLEECWAHQSDETRARFARCLMALAQDDRIWVIATVRSDFVPRMEGVSEWAQLLDAAQSYTLLPPRPDELVEMIREPSAAAGLQWERTDGVALDQVVLRDAMASPEGLPLLEFALERLYEHRRGALLTFEAYTGFGGLSGSIADAAEDSIAIHGNDEAAVRAVFRLLVRVEPGGVATRRHASREEFARKPATQRLLGTLERRRLCILDRSDITFAHEALITAWPRLKTWLAAESTLLQARERLHADAKEWRDHGRPRSLLATAPEKLGEAHRLNEAELDVTEDDTEFINASLRRAARLRLIRTATMAGIAVMGIAAAVLAAWALVQRDDAQHARALALARQGAGAMAAGDHKSAQRLLTDAENAWRDRNAQPDPEVAFEKLKVNLVREVETNADKYGPMLYWHFSSIRSRQSSFLLLGTAYGDVVVVDPLAGGTVLLKNHGAGVSAVAGSQAMGFVAIDDAGRLTRYDGRTGDRKETLEDAVPAADSSLVCDAGTCQAVGWNKASKRCEVVRFAYSAQSTWAAQRWPLHPAGGTKARFDTPADCAWTQFSLQQQHDNTFIAINRSGAIFTIDTSQAGAATAALLNTNVASAAVLDGNALVLQRASLLERIDVATRAVEPLSANAAQVDHLEVSVPGGLVAALSEDGTVELLRDGRAYRLGRTEEMPLRVFELKGTRAILEVSTSGMVRMLDYRSGRELYRWRAAPSPLRIAFFSVNEHRLSVLTATGDLHVWDVSGLEASPVAAAAHATSGASSRPAQHSIHLQPTPAGFAWPLNAEVQHVLVDTDADLAVLSTPDDGLVLFRGHTYRMPGFRPVMSARVGAGRWLVSDSRRIWSIAAGTDGAPTPVAEAVWNATGNEIVSRIVALDSGGIVVVLPSLVALLDEDGTERARTSRAGIDEPFAADLVRARLAGDVLVLENSACNQRRIHVPTGRVLHAPDRVCEEPR